MPIPAPPQGRQTRLGGLNATTLTEARVEAYGEYRGKRAEKKEIQLEYMHPTIHTYIRIYI